jgi:dimethylglycine dehydrogenase
MSFRKVEIGMAPVWLSRMTYTGDLGYEIWCAPEYQRYLFDLLWEAGQPHGMALFGFRALITMRLEKHFGTWYREYRPIYTPLEAAMDRYLKFDHEFIGRQAVEAELAAGGPKRKLVMFEVDVDPDVPADVIGDEPVWHNDVVVGWITSGGYAHYSGLSLAWGYIPTELAARVDDEFEIEIIGVRRPAKIQVAPALDPEGLRMRA